MIDQQVAHLYEQSSDWDERMKRRWRQAIQPARIRLGLRGSPGSGKTFLTRDAAVTLARASAAQIKNREVHLHDVPVPFWITAKALAVASGADANELVVNACLLSLERIRKDLPKPPMHWIHGAAESQYALIVVDALDELADEETGFRLASPRLKDVKGRLIATCRTLHWEQRANWLGWPNVTEVELAPFERREQREFARKFPSGVGAPGLEPLLSSNFPLRQACSSPLLLAFVCLLLAEGKNLAGANRVTVYIEIVRKLLSGAWRNVTPPWKGKRGLQEDVLEFLETAALSIFQASPASNRFTLVQFKRAGDARGPHSELLDELVRCGLLVEAGDNEIGESCWSLLHRTFLEFLAGRALARKPQRLWLDEAKKHFWYEPEWIEVLTFLAAHVNDATPLIEALEQEKEDIFRSILYLKGRLAGVARTLEPATLQVIVSEAETLASEICLKRSHLRHEGGPDLSDEGFRELSEFCNALIQSAGSRLLTDCVADRLAKLLPEGLLRAQPVVARALWRLGDERGLKALSELVRSEDPLTFHGAGYALGEIGDERGFETLFKMLHDPSRWKREVAAEALGLFGCERALQALLGVLRGEQPLPIRDILDFLADEMYRSNLTTALGHFGTRQAFETLTEMLLDESPRVRLAAAEALDRSGDARVVSAIVGLLLEDDPYIRLMACEELGRSGDTRAIEALAGMALDDEREIRVSAAKGLGQLGDNRGFKILEEMLRDEDSHLRYDAAVALGELVEFPAFEALAGMRSDPDRSVRVGAAQSLGRLGDPRAVEVLEFMLTDADRDVRRSAAEALGRTGGQRSIDALVVALADKEEWVRLEIGEALSKLGDPRALGVLSRIVADAEAEGRFAAARALGDLGDQQAVEVLVAALQDRDELLRDAAIKALRKLVATHRMIRLPADLKF